MPREKTGSGKVVELVDKTRRRILILWLNAKKIFRSRMVYEYNMYYVLSKETNN